MQDSLYKYLPDQYVESFVGEGALLFRSLSYFRDYEDGQVRGDEFEGTKLYRPTTGLEVTLTATGEKRILPHSFESTTNEDNIFVICLSTELSADLASQFNTSVCVEVIKRVRLISGIRQALLRRPSVKNKILVHGEVRYYNPDDPLIVDWALPDKIAMSKLTAFESQKEYRFAYSINGAFEVENTRLRLVPPGERMLPRASDHPQQLLKIGSLANVCRLHHFK